MSADPLATILPRSLELLDREFAELPAFEPQLAAAAEESRMAAVLAEVAHRMGDNYPYFHPLYAGQMLKPPHPVARAAYAMAMVLNPNNHARDGGRASSEMEIEAVGELARMFGWTDGPGSYLGHLTSGGTMANLEALWVAGELAAGNGAKRRIVASEQAHYTHSRISHVLKLPFGSIAVDERGRMRLDRLEEELKKGDVGTVVATLGTTAIGAVDPLEEVLALREKYGFRVHVDAAYGGYFRLIPEELGEEARRSFAVIDQADSIVVDPHKHGLQPYGCGCVLFRNPGVGRLYKHDSPYTYFTSKQLHLGEISLECSRAGASAVALWATQKLLPPVPGGEFAQGLARGRRAALELDRRLRADGRFIGLGGQRNGLQEKESGEKDAGPELDIVVWAIEETGGNRASAAGSIGAEPNLDAASALAEKVFAAAAARDLHLALVQLPQSWFGSSGLDARPLTCLRSVLMKPEHEAWLPVLWNKLTAACDEVLSTVS